MDKTSSALDPDALLRADHATSRVPPGVQRQLDMLQIATIASFSDVRVSFRRRVAMRLREQFFGQPFRQKVSFGVRGMIYLRRRYLAKYAKSEAPPPLRSKRAASDGLRVGVLGTGSLGDYVECLAFLQAFREKFAPEVLHFYCRKPFAAKVVLHGSPFVDAIVDHHYWERFRPEYDVVITITHQVKYDVYRADRILDFAPDLLNTIAESDRLWTKDRMFYDHHPLLDGLFARSMEYRGMNRAAAIAYYAGLELPRPIVSLKAEAEPILAAHGLDTTPYITVHDGVDAEYTLMGRQPTKCWPLDHWGRFTTEFKRSFPGVQVVQLGNRNSRPIAGVDVQLIGKTNLYEAAWVLRRSLAHVDGESGLVRLAHALGTRSAVVFGPTNLNFFALPGNSNLAPTECGDCWWSTPEWLSVCPRGLADPVCTGSIEPHTVLRSVSGILTVSSAAVPVRQRVWYAAAHSAGSGFPATHVVPDSVG